MRQYFSQHWSYEQTEKPTLVSPSLTFCILHCCKLKNFDILYSALLQTLKLWHSVFCIAANLKTLTFCILHCCKLKNFDFLYSALLQTLKLWLSVFCIAANLKTLTFCILHYYKMLAINFISIILTALFFITITLQYLKNKNTNLKQY